MLILGASSGIGRATALRAAEVGIKLVLTARSEEALKTLVDEIGPEHAIAVPADITEFDAVDSVAKTAIDKFGRLDVVFANAGTGINQPGTEGGDPGA